MNCNFKGLVPEMKFSLNCGNSELRHRDRVKIKTKQSASYCHRVYTVCIIKDDRFICMQSAFRRNQGISEYKYIFYYAMGLGHLNLLRN